MSSTDKITQIEDAKSSNPFAKLNKDFFKSSDFKTLTIRTYIDAMQAGKDHADVIMRDNNGKCNEDKYRNAYLVFLSIKAMYDATPEIYSFTSAEVAVMFNMLMASVDSDFTLEAAKKICSNNMAPLADAGLIRKVKNQTKRAANQYAMVK